MIKTSSLLVTISILAFVIQKSTHFPKVLTESKPPPTVEEYIQAKLVTNTVNDTFSPVLIYAYNHEKHEGRLAGSGTMFDHENGKAVLTAKHLFHKSWGTTCFVIKRLRPLDDDNLKYAIGSVSVLEVSDMDGCETDMALCTVITNLLSPISCKFDDKKMHQIPMEEFTFENSQSAEYLTNLVSGKTYPIIGIGRNICHSCFTYFLIPSAVVEGEGGTGFVDRNGGLYVLKGSVVKAVRLSTETKGRFGINSSVPMSIVMGIIKIQSKYEL